jgi:2-keto-4-pentenoate hydratase/2-oxohepta-3-ene-1,7-dioic acid hydratase in catechol pathway
MVFKDLNGNAIDLPVGKAICVGRNYADHIDELGNERPSSPLLFIKPNTAIVDMSESVHIPTRFGECHNELELTFLVKNTIDRHTEIDFEQHIYGVGLALDLTLRDVQTQSKQKGHPWEKAKAFDGSCPVSQFVPISAHEIQDLTFSLHVNGEIRQQGHSALMLFPVMSLLNEIKQLFTLHPGDIVLTGTPKGVGPLVSGDVLLCDLDNHFSVSTRVEPWR